MASSSGWPVRSPARSGRVNVSSEWRLGFGLGAGALGEGWAWAARRVSSQTSSQRE